MKRVQNHKMQWSQNHKMKQVQNHKMQWSQNHKVKLVQNHKCNGVKIIKQNEVNTKWS